MPFILVSTASSLPQPTFGLLRMLLFGSFGGSSGSRTLQSAAPAQAQVAQPQQIPAGSASPQSSQPPAVPAPAAQPPPQQSSSTIYGTNPINQLTASDQQQVIDIHNAERIALGNPPLRWDVNMESAAIRCMQTYNITTITAGLCQNDTTLGSAGENISNSGTGAVISNLFINEKCNIKDMNALTTPNAYKFDSTIGHYTQAIWKESLRMSCVQIQQGGVIYCHYLAGGNIQGMNESVVQIAPNLSSCPNTAATPTTATSPT